MSETAAKIKSGKATGPDRIPPEVIKMTRNEHTDYLVRVMNELVERGEFFKPGIPETYRSICLVEVITKLLERIIL